MFSYLLIIPIRLYQIFISPFLGRNCRYHPSCSCYAQEAIKKHGAVRGMALGGRRLLSCHPWSKREIFDPVPERFAWRDIFGYNRSHARTPSKE